jgi:Ca2+/Na+ antiporter
MNQTISSAVFAFALLADGDASQRGWLAGAVGGVLGALIGLGGGVFGTYCSIKNTRTAAERRFMVRSSVVLWLVVIVMVLVPSTLSPFGIIPVWLQWMLMALFAVMLLPFILWVNRYQAQLRGPQGPGAPLQV